MIPVLGSADPAAARHFLMARFGFVPTGGNRLALGGQVVELCALAAPPDGLIALPLDHLALRVADADAAMQQMRGRGAVLDSRFTPEGPREIAEFWQHGVRFIFFEGPEGTAFEFCQQIGQESVPDVMGHDHFGIRTPDLDATEAICAALGATRVAAHRLGGDGTPVDVRFLRRGGDCFELFNEPLLAARGTGRFVGLLPA